MLAVPLADDRNSTIRTSDADEEAVGVARPEPVLADAAAGISNGFGKAPQ
jgi:hypothetical protein